MFSGPGEFAVTAGWGVTGFEEGLSPTLMMLQVCSNFLYCQLVPQRYICASDSCHNCGNGDVI